MSKSNVCSLCKRPFEEHTKPYCPYCGRPKEHHRPGDEDEEMRQAAKFAKIRVDIGTDLVKVTDDADGKAVFKRVPVELTAAQKKALKRFPDP